MAEIKDIVDQIRGAMSIAVCPLVKEALDGATLDLRNQTSTALDGQTLIDEKDKVLERFQKAFEKNFTEIVGVGFSREPDSVFDYANLRLVEEEDLEAIIAMEGMVAHARNTDIHQYLCYTTRLDALVIHTKIDESNDPMDPEQIGDAFKHALQPSGLRPNALLVTYRYFNIKVFHNLEKILEEANAILISYGILPDLDISARHREDIKNKRSKRRRKSDPNDHAFSNEDTTTSTSSRDQEVFSIIQRLMHSPQPTATAHPGGSPTGAPGVASKQAILGGELQSGMMIGQQRVELVAGDKLIGLLNSLNENAVDEALSQFSGKSDLSESIASKLKSMSDGKTLQAIDSNSSDIINLVNLLYEAIWEDNTVPIPVKELIGRTQISVLKIALSDARVFDQEDHPVRELINALATAGISWTETDDVADDPMYIKMEDIVSRLNADSDLGAETVSELLEEFRFFKRRQLLESQQLEDRLMDADERTERLEDVKQYARQKIVERILDPALPNFVREFLDSRFHQFLVKVILREGPGGISWRPVMNTIDVLLWTVNSERSSADLERFQKLKSRLLINLGKALEVAGFEKKEIDQDLKRLLQIQEGFFKPKENSTEDVDTDQDFESWLSDAKPVVDHHLPELQESDEHMQQVSKIPIGIWMEFQFEGEQTIRCTLAAKIDTIDKYIFVNAQGVKVIEKSKMGLARELKAGTVKVISQAPLIDRAMETVIGKLRSQR